MPLAVVALVLNDFRFRPPHSLRQQIYWPPTVRDTRLRIRAVQVGSCSAPPVGTPAARAWLMAFLVLRHHSVVGRTTSTAMSVTFAPRPAFR